ncbi:histone deacetylase [Streptomyces pinistramenti]|uniref:histone deacetylase n=1 Tax=Streptomyces pinistramenti TaxID=2884812 RepID=UPI001D078FB3|nr:histone deacetylase [Streptomyces pinistramenti]MCB5911601.1 histone deacetylase [Streptomyces pinistramenti]
MSTAHSIEPGPISDLMPQRVWYTSYGSNMHLGRLACYLAGGRPPGAAKVYPGCRDRSLPAESVPVELPGSMYFATDSPVWGGGRAFYDPAAEGRVLARAHLVSAAQFADVAAQEMYREPGVDLDLTQVLSEGRAVMGEGRYETLVCAGRMSGLPVLTFTAPWEIDDVAWNSPSPAYVRLLSLGLLEAGAWDATTVATYVASCPGAAGHWTEQAIGELIRGRGAAHG